MEVLFEKAVPIKSRQAYRYDAWASILAGLFTGTIMPFYLLIARKSLDASPFLISLMTASLFIGNVLSLLSTNAMEGKRKMPFVVWPWYIGRGIFFLMLFATTPLSFALIVSIGNCITSLASPAYAAVMKDVYPDAHRGRIMGYVRALVAFSMMITTLTAGWMMKIIGYEWLFPLGAVFGILSAYFFSKIKTPSPSSIEIAAKRSTLKFLHSSFSILKHNRGFRWFAISVVIYGLGTLILSPVYPLYQADKLGLTYRQLAMLTIGQNVAWMFAYIYWGKYIDMRSPLRATVVNVYLAVLVPMGYFFAWNWWALAPAHLIAGITNAGIEMAYFSAVLSFSGEGRTSHYQALFAFIGGIRGIFAPSIGGALVEGFVR
ncbi:MAG TPA: MFS transporter, partial [Armatimonadota bacterium]|nr:MFS transporter [Armatimonadota bacterium]